MRKVAQTYLTLLLKARPSHTYSITVQAMPKLRPAHVPTPKPRPRPQPTHFLCLPILTPHSRPHLAKSLAHFRAVADEFRRPAAALDSSGERGRQRAISPGSREPLIPESAMRPLGTLHLTIGVMHLDDGELGQGGGTGKGLERARGGRYVVPGSREEDGDGAFVGAARRQKSMGKTVDHAVALLEGLDLASLLSKSKYKVSAAAQRQVAYSTPGAKSSEPHEQSRDDIKTSLGSDLKKGVSSDDGPIDHPIEPPVPMSLQREISPPSTSTLHRLSNTSSDGVNQITTPPPSSPLRISLRSLSAFPSPVKATVLHAIPHDPTRRLLPFAKALQHAFLASNLMTVENRDLKLHVSVVNTIYAGKDKERNGGDSRRAKQKRAYKVTIDARELIEVFSKRSGRFAEDIGGPELESGQDVSEASQTDFVWADHVVIDRVRICKMGAQPVEGDEELGREYVVVYEKMILST